MSLLLQISLLIGLAAVAVLAASERERGIGRSRFRPIDEILAIAGDMRHGWANPRGRNRAFGMKRLGGKAEIIEYDILRAIPEETMLKRGAGRIRSGRKTTSRFEPKRIDINSIKRSRQNRSSRIKRNAISYTGGLWTGGVVPYDFESGLSQTIKDAFAKAVTDYNDHTCIKWTPRESEKNYVRVSGSGSGCFSTIGMAGGRQILNINNDTCIYHKVIIHEMLHALGVFHEHTRPDRDSFVTINTGNINPGAENNFKERTATKVYGIPYDYRSVMHYSKRTFSSNGGNTVVPKDSAFLDVIGTAPTLSFRDIQLINVMYDCPGLKKCGNVSCPSNGFLGPNCQCRCPSSDYTNPVITCAEVCPSIGKACNCPFWVDACNALTHSHCDITSKACKCDNDYTEHNKECTLISSIKCTSLNTDCKCSLNNGACEEQLSDATCDMDSNKCICSGSFIESNGICVNLNTVACDVAGKTCGCSSKGTSACSNIPHSSCDRDTDACTCDTGYFKGSGVCSMAPPCTTMGSSCHCETQDPSACAAIANTICNQVTGACECPSLYISSGGKCHLQHVSDGETVSPFKRSDDGNIKFEPTAASALSGDNSAFGISSNDFYLSAGGFANDKAVIETGFITRKAGETICLKVGVHLKGAKLVIHQYVGNPWHYWNAVTLYYSRDLGYYYPYQRSFSALSSTSEVKFTLTAERYQSSLSSDWFVRLDPLYIGEC